MTRIILASGSPRRRDLLAGLGLDFAVAPVEVDETPLPGESPRNLVRRLSRAKGLEAAGAAPDALVIAADTVVVLQGEILGKPRDLEQNRDFIRRLAGRSHTVVTGHYLAFRSRAEELLRCTEVQFRPLSEEEIERFVSTREGLDKAGGYAIQGYGATLVEEIHGCYFNVVGLSVAAVVEGAKRLGVPLV